MQIPDLLQLHDETTQKCRAIMERKNSDYTGGKTATDALANFKTATALGLHPVTGLLLRMQDKLMRVRSFVADGELRVTGETVEDACDDLVNYAILCKALLRGEGAMNNTPRTDAECMSGETRYTDMIHYRLARQLERERDEWKAKYIQQNKDLGCEMMDPNGTIWDYATKLQSEVEQLKSQLTQTHGCVTISRNGYVQEVEQQRDTLAEELDSTKQSILNLSHPNMKLLSKELAEAREQRDRLADAALRLADIADKNTDETDLWETIIADVRLLAAKGGEL